ncbi:hypothetical protein [Acinetobacter sp. ANC 4805]|uniref:hypothetical protein n=1 Tax=Acinetobacter sp. ANC 4805 TaxID=2923425 RepID=UPI001F4A3D45|nr:hypothetical protein [Acinetobacter sp. ANC 4805]MCH7310546.1 hypothetical protein [Acinetobacter sp. ANC 4805]
MNTIKLITGLSLITSMIGCATANHIKMSDVSNFKSPNDVIAAKQLNGKSGSGKEYMVSSELLDHKIPFTYLKTFCESQNGHFVQTYQSKFSRLTTPIQGYTDIALKYIGGFTCSASQPWGVRIEPIANRYNQIYQLTFLTLKTELATPTDLLNASNVYYRLDLKKQREIDAQIQQRNQEVRNQQQKYQQMVAANAPKVNDIGRTICKDTSVSEYTGLVVLGQPQFQTVDGAKVIASLEAISNNNLKITIKGWLSSNNSIASGVNVMYKQTPLESGRVIWDSKENWYTCLY